MINYLKKFSLFSAISLVFISNIAMADALDDQLNASISAYFSKNQTPDHISSVQLSVLLPHEDQPRNYIVGTQYFGEPPKATTDMMFQWGSITKEYTNVLIFQLVHQGLFSTNDHLGDLQILKSYFDPSNPHHWPAAWKNITINQLMNMTSGIPSYTSIGGGIEPASYTLEDLINIAADYQNTQGCDISVGCFTPAGSQWVYSNTNYIILGLIAEKFSGTSYQNLLNTNILSQFQEKDPAKPVNVYYDADFYPANVLSNMVHSYFPYQLSQKITAWGDWTNWNLSWAASAGALTGNMQTLVRMTQALYQNKIDSHVKITDFQSNLVEMPSATPVVSEQDVQKDCVFDATKGPTLWGSCFANGIMTVYSPKYGQVWWYAGDTMAYRTVYLYFPERHGFIVAISTDNGQGPGHYLIDLEAFKVGDIILKYLNSNSN